MALSMKNVDIPSMLVLTKLYQTRCSRKPPPPPPAGTRAATDRRRAGPGRSQRQPLLAAKPQVALENLSLKTTHGESKFNLVLDLAKPRPWSCRRLSWASRWSRCWMPT
jgi:uncharacterized protein YdgA (DUF945 family)